MTPAHAALLVLAGVGAGLTGGIAGLASLVSYPALLAAGLPPVAANVSNTVGLLALTAGNVRGYRPELRGQAGRFRRLLPPAALGGAVGGALLLLTPSDAFARIVPWLIGAAALLILVRRPVASGHGRSGPALIAGVFAVSVYGGYFGAAAGVVVMALLLTAWPDETLPRVSAIRTVLLGTANLVAAVGYVAFGPVQWSAVLPLAVGLFAGGRIAPEVVRRVPAGPLRIVIAVAGLALAVRLALDAY